MPSIYEAIKPKKNSIFDAISEPNIHPLDIPISPESFDIPLDPDEYPKHIKSPIGPRGERESDIATVFRAIKELQWPTTEYMQRESEQATNELEKRLLVIGANILTLGKRLGPKDLLKKIDEQEKSLAGFGPALTSIAGKTSALAIEWGYLYPALFKLVGMGGSAISKIPRVAKATEAIKKIGGLNKLAERFPRAYARASNIIKSFGKGATVGGTVAGAETIGKEMKPGEVLGHISKRAVILGGVAAGFQTASEIDNAVYTSKLRKLLTEASNRRFALKIAEVQANIPQGPRQDAAFNSLGSLKNQELRNINDIVSAAEAQLLKVKANKLYQSGQELVETPEEAARRFIEKGFLSSKPYAKGPSTLKKGMPGEPQPFIKMPTSRVGEAKEAIVESMAKVRHPVKAIRKAQMPSKPPSIKTPSKPKISQIVPPPVSDDAFEKEIAEMDAEVEAIQREAMAEADEKKAAEKKEVRQKPEIARPEKAGKEEISPKPLPTKQVTTEKQEYTELTEQRGAFEKYKANIPDATEQEIVRFMIQDGLRPPKAVLERNSEMPEVREIFAQDKTEEVARQYAEEKAKPVTKDEFRAKVREEIAARKAAEAEAAEKQPWEMTREDYVGEGYIQTGKVTDLALKRQVNIWQKRIDAGATSEGAMQGLESAKRKLNRANEHKQAVQQALSEGLPVPAEVLAEYPDLAKQAQPPAEETAKPIKSPDLAYSYSSKDNAETATKKFDAFWQWHEKAGHGEKPDNLEDAVFEYLTEQEEYQDVEGPLFELDDEGKYDTPEGQRLQSKLDSMRSELEQKIRSREDDEKLKQKTPEKMRLIEATVIGEEEAAEREGTISPGRRRRLIKEIEAEILEDEMYLVSKEERERRQLAVTTGVGQVIYIHPKYKGEIEKAIGDHPNLKFMITTKDRSRPHWDSVAKQMADRLGIEEGMDINEFLEIFAETMGKKYPGTNLYIKDLEAYEESGNPAAEIKAQKLRMLTEGASPDEINDMIRELGEGYGIEPELYEDELVGPEAKKLKDIRAMEEGPEKEAQLYALAEKNVLLRERRDAKNAVNEVLAANELAVYVREVEKIEPEKVQRDLLSRPVFEPATVGKTKELGIEPGEITEKEVAIKYELSEAVAELANQNITEPKEVAATLMERKGWKELFKNPSNPLPEVKTAIREAVEGRSLPFEMRGEPVGAAITTPAGKEIVLLAYGADSQTGYHEGYHILRGHLTDKDVKVLDKHYKGDTEREAREFAEYAKTGKSKVGYLKGIWRKLVEKLKKIKSMLQGRGYRTVQDIFGEIVEGKVEKIPVITKEGLSFEVKMPEEYEARLVDAWKKSNERDELGIKKLIKGKRWLVTGKGFGTVAYADNYEQAIEKAWVHKNKASTGISSMEKKAKGQPSHVVRPAVAGENLPVPDISEAIVTDRAIAHLPQQDQPRTEPEIPEEANVKTTKGITARQVKNKFSDEKNIKYATGDVVKGDIILFDEAVFGGSYRKPKFLGKRTVVAEVLKESYGSKKQQHTFTIKVLYSYGYDALEPGKKTTRKGRNIYRNGTDRLEWPNESERQKIAEEKHERGDRARQVREYRRQQEWEGGGQVQFETSNERARREAIRRAQINAEKARLKAMAERKPKKVKRTRLKIELHDYTPSLPGLGQEPGAVKTPRPGMRVKTDVMATPKLGEEFKETELPKGKMVKFRETEFGPAPAPNRRATKAELEENRRQQKKTMQAIDKLKQVSQKLGHSAEKRIFEVSERLRRIDPELKRQVRLREERMAERIHRDLKDREGFLKKTREMTRDDWLDFDYAASIGDNVTVDRLAAKYDMVEEVAKVREILDGLYEGHVNTGRKVNYRENMWPRRVKNRDGLFNELVRQYGRSNILGPYEAALERRRQQAGGRQLTEEEKNQVLNSMVRGFGQRVWLSRPGILKTRSLWDMTPELKKYYYDTRQSLDMYIYDSHDAISAAEFFGKTTKRILDLRAQRSRLATRLYKLSTRVGYKRPMTEPKYKEHISKAKERFEMINQQLNDLQDMSLQDSIGAYLFGMVAEGRLTHKQEERINQIFEAYFQPRKIDAATKTFKTCAYMATLGSHLQTLTQLKDYARILYRAPLDALPATARAIIPGLKSRYTMDELSIEATSIDIEGLSKILDGTLSTTSFRRVDKLMKEIYVDAVLSRYYRQAKRARNLQEGTTFRERIEAHMGKDTENTIRDLKSGKKTELTKRLAFNEVLDMHPVARSELTEQYLRGGGTTKALYTLRTFGLKEFTYAQREIISGMKQHPARNAGRLVWLAFTVALAGGGIEALKDIIRGKKVNLADDVIDEWLRLLLMSRYTVGIMKKEGPAKGYLRSLLPPSKMIDAPITDILKGEVKESVRLIPVVGELYYWWFGEGRRKEEAKKGLEIE